MARIDGPGGSRLRLGVVHPEDAGKWRAADKGGTVELDAAGAEQLRNVALQSAAEGKKNVADFRAQLKAAHKAGLPESQWPDVEADIASGVIRGSDFGDLHWSLTREEGPEFSAGGVDYGAGGEWNLALKPVAASGASGGNDFNAAKPATTSKLNKALADLMSAPEGRP